MTGYTLCPLLMPMPGFTSHSIQASTPPSTLSWDPIPVDKDEIPDADTVMSQPPTARLGAIKQEVGTGLGWGEVENEQEQMKFPKLFADKCLS